jgi:hypothetical protein
MEQESTFIAALSRPRVGFIVPHPPQMWINSYSGNSGRHHADFRAPSIIADAHNHYLSRYAPEIHNENFTPEAHVSFPNASYLWCAFMAAKLRLHHGVSAAKHYVVFMACLYTQEKKRKREYRYNTGYERKKLLFLPRICD